MEKDKIIDLANLARMNISEEEARGLAHELESVLVYVGEIKKVDIQDIVENKKDNYPHKNVMREDSESHEGGLYTERILEQAPKREKDFIKVKQVLG